MNASVIEPLVAQWVADATLKSKAQSWNWFRQAFGQVLHNHAAPLPGWHVDEDILAAVFFLWAEAAELYAPYEAVDAADFRQFVLGQLLQKLFEARPPVLRNTPIQMTPVQGTPIQVAAVPLTSFVLTLLQALHVAAGHARFTLNEATVTGPRWASFLENVAEDASTATCFLDQMTGLEPIWQSRSLIEHRPAMQTAMALRQAPLKLRQSRVNPASCWLS